MSKLYDKCKKRGFHFFSPANIGVPYNSYEEAIFTATCETCGQTIEAKGEWRKKKELKR